MSTPKRRRRPSMYQSAAKIRKKYRAAADREIHQPTGLSYRILHSILKSDFRYCAWWKGASGQPFICAISQSDQLDDLTEMNVQAARITRMALSQRPDIEEVKIGMVEVRLLSPSKIKNLAKVKDWLKSPDPQF